MDFHSLEQTDAGISSVMDTWLLLRDIQVGRRAQSRVVRFLKSRFMSHSSEIREFLLTDNGIDLRDVYVGPEEF